MALDYQVQNIDGLDQNVRNLYVQNDGKYVLDVTGVKAVSDFDNVKKALNSERTLRSEFQKKYKSFGDIKPDDINNLKTQLEEYKLGLKTDDKDVQARINQIKSLYQTKEKNSTTRLSDLENQLNQKTSFINNINMQKAIMSQISQVVNQKSIKDVMALAKLDIKYNQDLDQFCTSDGVNLSEWSKDFFAQRPYFTKTSVSGGSKGGKGKGVKTNPFKDGDINASAQLLRTNPVLAKQMIKEAGLQM